MGRSSRLKRERNQKERESLNEAWRFFTSRGFLRQVRQMIHDAGGPPQSSVACTKVFSELGASIGLDVRPLPVEVTAYNPIFTAHIEKHGLNPSEEEMTALGETGGRYVVLGARDEKKEVSNLQWPGHLVALMSAKGKPLTVVDLTIDRAHRPNDDIVLTDPLIFGVPRTFLSGSEVAEGIIGTPKGKVCLIYRPLPDDQSFLQTPEWQRDYGARTHDKIDIDSGLDE